MNTFNRVYIQWYLSSIYSKLDLYILMLVVASIAYAVHYHRVPWMILSGFFSLFGLVQFF